VVTYKYLADNLNPEIDVCFVEFPGRGARISEALVSDLNSTVQSIYKSILPHLDIPVVFLGHSMGALISYELTHYLKAHSNKQPQKLYLSAHRAPSVKHAGKLMHKLDEKEFLKEIINMNGVSKDILEHKELLELVLPIIKNDYELCETYKFSEKGKLNIPICTFGGIQDKDIEVNHLLEWENFTESKFQIEMFDGDHFFILKNKEEFLKRFSIHINKDLLKVKLNYA